MSDGRITFALPSSPCAIVGFGLALVVSFVLGILLGTLWSFGLVLHVLMVALVGYMLAMRCTENGGELFGLVELLHVPNSGAKLAEAAGRAVEAAGRLPEKVADAARDATGRKDAAEPPAAPPPARPDAPPPAQPAAQPAAQPVAPAAAAPEAPAAAPESDAREGTRPPLLDGPPPNGGDDLTSISGVGPKLAAALHGIGVYHFSQIANWNEDELAWVDRHLVSFRGRASRDDWVGQAAELLRGAAPKGDQQGD